MSNDFASFAGTSAAMSAEPNSKKLDLPIRLF
jgi:hypothetical protein